MNKPIQIKRNRLIIGILAFSCLVFVVGAVLFFKFDADNNQLKATLLEKGIKGKAHLLATSKETNRRLSSTDFKWQYSDKHIVRYWYNHTMKEDIQDFSLEKYLNQEADSKAVDKEGLGRVEVESSISEELYKKLKTGGRLNIVYLAGQPNSVKILDENGNINVPALYIFTYTCFFLTLIAGALLYFYLKTGQTV